MKAKLMLALLAMVPILCGKAQELSLKVWPSGAPEDNGMTLPEVQEEGFRVMNVSEAEITLFFLPGKSTQGQPW